MKPPAMTSTLRPLLVFAALLPFVVSFLRDWRGWIVFGEPRKLTPEGHRERARRIREMCARLGPAFIKGAQVLSTREDILPRAYTEELSKLQDSVPPFPARVAVRLLGESLGRPVGEVFESFEREPIAAASLGQVHRAVYKGKPVAVKILRPGVEEVVEADLRVVVVLLRLVHFFVESHFVRSFWAIIQEYQRMIHQEMDFRNEQRNADRFRGNFRDDPRIVVPRCFNELTTRRTVVFEFVRGARPDDREGLRAIGVEPHQLLDLMIETYVRMTVIHGFIHADPHPGNLLVDSRKRLVILDYGMALSFPDKVRREMLRACLCVVRRDVDGIVDAFYTLGLVDRDANRALIRDAAETLMSIQLRDDFTPRMIQEIADDILDTFHRFPLRMPQQLVYLFRASALVEGLGMKYDVHFSGLREATPVIKKMIKEVRLEPEFTVRGQVEKTWAEGRRAVRYLGRVITRLEREEQRLRLDSRDVAVFDQLARVLVRRLLVGMASIGAWLFAGLLFVQTGSLLLMASISLPAFAVFLLCLALPMRRGEPLRNDEGLIARIPLAQREEDAE
mgnify:CR=1 FL=1